MTAYRELEAGEVIEEHDEYFFDGEWHQLSPSDFMELQEMAAHYMPNDGMPPYRRPVTTG